MWNVVYGFLAACGVSLALNAGEYDTFFSNSFIIFIIFLAYVLLYAQKTKLSRRQFCCGCILCFTISCCTVLGIELEKSGGIDWCILTPIKIVGLMFATYPIVNIGISKIDASGKGKKNNKAKNSQTKNKYISIALAFARKHKTLTIFMTIFLFGFFVFLATYPGIYAYDAGSQLASYFSDEVALRDHFSVPFVLLFGGVVKIGHWVFGSYNAGYATFILLQLAFMSLVAAKLCLFVLTEFRTKKLFYLSIAFFCIFPLYTITVVSAIQDVIFAGITALLFIELYRIGKDPAQYWKKKSNYFLFGILALGVCLARNNGVYMLAAALPIVVFATSKGKRILTCVMILIPIATYFVIKGPVYNILGIEKGNAIMEMSSAPSQQLARVFVKHKGEFSENEIMEIERYYNTSYFEEFYEANPSIADWMKAGIKSEEVKKDPLGYIGLWVKYSLKYPTDYVDAFAMNTYAFWYPNKAYPDFRMYHPLIEYENLELDSRISYLGIKRSSKFPIYDQLLRIVSGGTNQTLAAKGGWEFVPVFSTLFTMGFYFVITLASIVLTFLYKKWHYFVPLAIVIGLYCTLLLSPVALFRYCLPIVILSPLLMGMCIISSKD